MENVILLNKARSALTESPNYNLVKETYGFVDTSKIVERFERQGWNLHDAKQAKVKTMERNGYQKHLLRFRNENFQRIDGLQGYNESIPELIVENSHDGTSALKIFFGVFRIACLNGIIAGSSFNSMRVIHSSNSILNIDQGIDTMTAGIPELIEKVNRFSTIQLSPAQKIEMAKQATDIRMRNVKKVEYVHLENALRPKRFNDTNQDAFSVFNVLQEKAIRGGFAYAQREDDGRLVWKTTRAVNSVNQSVKINRELWDALERVTA